MLCTILECQIKESGTGYECAFAIQRRAVKVVEDECRKAQL